MQPCSVPPLIVGFSRLQPVVGVQSDGPAYVTTAVWVLPGLLTSESYALRYLHPSALLIPPPALPTSHLPVVGVRRQKGHPLPPPVCGSVEFGTA
jgi:hypothetical protein